MPLVSVIVTTYNRKELLSETLNSILNQTFQDFELIVVDNFSNYDFLSHISSFSNPKIIAFQNKNNGIIAVNRNYGLKHAKGDFIAFCDDDDIWLPTKLEKQIDALKKSENDQDKKLIYSEVILFGDDIDEKSTTDRKAQNINDLIKTNKIAFSSTLTTKSDLVVFDEDPQLVASEDFELWLRLVKNDYKLLYLQEPLIRYRVCNNSVFRLNSYNVHLKTVYALLKMMLKYGVSEVNVSKYVYKIYKELLKFFVKKILIKKQI